MTASKRRFFLLLCLSSILYTSIELAQAKPRQPDPDGCLTCHEMEGLQWIDENGVWRVATINSDHYYGSLHGSVPCKDCHRKITDYPHKVENGFVDCAESCHVEEPSEGEPYTHKPIADEFAESAHGKGWHKDFAGGNRLEEIDKSFLPSCRTCHANTSYIDPEKMPEFMEAFAHNDVACGKCHVGEVWMNQMGGHILRRFIGERINKNVNNQICIDCHDDVAYLADAELEDPETKEKSHPDKRWLNASKSYERTLHSRLIVVGIQDGASCIDCHSPGTLHHAIKRDEDETSSTHPDNLPDTCGASGCHLYAKDPDNMGFTLTDVHDVDQLSLALMSQEDYEDMLSSTWSKVSIFLIPIMLIMIGGAIVYAFIGKNKGLIMAWIGGEHFQVNMAGKKPAKKKTAAKTKTAPAKPIRKAALKTDKPESKDSTATDSATAKADPKTAPVKSTDEAAPSPATKSEETKPKPADEAIKSEEKVKTSDKPSAKGDSDAS